MAAAYGTGKLTSRPAAHEQPSSAAVRGHTNRDLWLAELGSNIISEAHQPFRCRIQSGVGPDERPRSPIIRRERRNVSPFVKDLDSGKEEQQFEPTESLTVEDWTADGRFLVLRSSGNAVFALAMSGARKLERLADTPYSEDQLQVSPDGQWIAFNSDESDVWEVWVARFPDFTEKRQVSVGGGVQPRWAPNSRELFYLTPDGTLMVHGPAWPPSKFAAPRALFKTSLNPAAAEQSEYDVTLDGQRFLILEHTRDRPQVFTYILNAVDRFNR